VTAVRRVVAAGAAALALTSCGSGTSSNPTTEPSDPQASPPHIIASEPQSVTPSAGETGGPEHPVSLTASQSLLSWHPVPGPTRDLVTVGDGWTLTVPPGAHEARLRGPRSVTIHAAADFRVTDAFLDTGHALVVTEDRLARVPDRATLVDLATGRATTLDGRSDPPTAVGGTWALGADRVLHATTGPHRTYCLATVDLAGRRGTTGWCAQPRHGFSRATSTPDGVTMMTFDAHRPSCRTVVQVDGTTTTPLPGVTDCKGWDSALVGGTPVWSVVPNERRIDEARFYAHTDQGWYDLGPGTSGTLVACAGAAYFVRDPQRSTDPARLLRWDPMHGSLTIAFASKGRGRAFLAAPRCGGDHLTVSAYSAAGDQQVTTRLN
jgi:hypothetical protein